MNFLFFPIESESEDPDFVFTAGPEEHQEEPVMKIRSSGLKFTVISIGVEIEWIVPCFPVLKIHVVKLSLDICGNQV